MKRNEFRIICQVPVILLSLMFSLGIVSKSCQPEEPIKDIMISTTPAWNIWTDSARSGGFVYSDGGADITVRGVCWDTVQNPEIVTQKTQDGKEDGPFESVITGLNPGTRYFVRAYATNSHETAYGEESILQTADGILSDVDGNIYPTIQIGGQLWMAENLKVTHYSDGSEITLVEGQPEWDDLRYRDKSYCWYQNDPAFKEIYGALYNWAAAMRWTGQDQNEDGIVQGICPEGWHLPSDDEWKTLELYLGMDPTVVNKTLERGTTEGSKLKEGGNTHWRLPNGGATNSSGFSGLPAGMRNSHGSFLHGHYNGMFWSTTEIGIQKVWHRRLEYKYQTVFRSYLFKSAAASVRCIKDADTIPTNPLTH